MKLFKNVFTSFRNAVIAFAGVILVLVIAGTCIVYATNAGREEIMDRSAALGYALADAGLKEGDITVTRQKLEKDDGRNYYEIEFVSSEYSYKYEIDAVSGAVTGVNIEAIQVAGVSGQVPEQPAAGNEQAPVSQVQSGQKDQTPDVQAQNDQQDQSQTSDGQTQNDQQDQSQTPDVQAQNDQQDQSQTPDVQAQNDQQDQTAQIDVDTAKTAALTDAGLSVAEVTFTKQKLDWDNGRAEYEIEFYTAEKEYEYEIDAVTGLVVDKSVEALEKQRPAAGTDSGSTDSYIGEDRAKEIATGDSGYDVTEVVFTKVELEQNDGRMEYEIEFYKDCMEYDYCIEACNGSILEYDYDHDEHCTKNHSHHSH